MWIDVAAGVAVAMLFLTVFAVILIIGIIFLIFAIGFAWEKYLDFERKIERKRKQNRWN